QLIGHFIVVQHTIAVEVETTENALRRPVAAPATGGVSRTGAWSRARRETGRTAAAGPVGLILQILLAGDLTAGDSHGGRDAVKHSLAARVHLGPDQHFLALGHEVEELVGIATAAAKRGTAAFGRAAGLITRAGRTAALEAFAPLALAFVG